MKKVLIILLAFALVFGLVLSSCDMFGGGGSSGGSRNPVIEKDPKPKKGAPNPVVDGANYLTISGRTANYFTVDIFTDNTFADYTADKDHTVTVYIKGPTSATQFFFGKGKSDYGSYGDSDSFDLVAGSGGVYKAVRKFTYAEISQKMNIRAVAADTISSITIYEITIVDEAGKSIYKMSADTDIQDAKDGADPFKASKDAGNDPPFTTWLKISGSPTIAVAVPGEDEVDDDPPVTPPEPQKFTITAGKATHDNFRFVKSTASAHGTTVDITEDEKTANKFVIKTGAIRYQFPSSADFNAADYDFVKIDYTSTSVKDLQIKQYNSSTGIDISTGSLAITDDGYMTFEIRYCPGGIALQKWSAATVTPAADIEITKITYTKGLRYPITFDAALPGVTVPSTAPKYVVHGTKVGPLPELTASGWTHVGWKFQDGTEVTKDILIDVYGADNSGNVISLDGSKFNYATLVASWAYTPKQDPQKVTLIDGDVVKKGGATVVIVNNKTYTVENGTDYGNSWAYFVHDFGTPAAELSHFSKLSFKLKGLSGDVTGDKNIYVFAGDESVLKQTYYNFIAADGSNGGSTQIAIRIGSASYSANNGLPDLSFEVALNQGAAIALDGKTIGIIIQLNADTGAKYQISDVVFSQD